MAPDLIPDLKVGSGGQVGSRAGCGHEFLRPLANRDLNDTKTVIYRLGTVGRAIVLKKGNRLVDDESSSVGATR